MRIYGMIGWFELVIQTNSLISLDINSGTAEKSFTNANESGCAEDKNCSDSNTNSKVAKSQVAVIACPI